MLILTRKMGETVVIGEDVYLTILGYRNGQVRLGFDAPPTMPINRDEIQRRIEQEKHRGDAYEELGITESVVDRLLSQWKRTPWIVTNH